MKRQELNEQMLQECTETEVEKLEKTYYIRR